MNFSSQTIRLTVNLFDNNNPSNAFTQQRKYFLKICLQTEDFRKACEECFYYEKEAEVYNAIIPTVEELLRSIEEPAQFAPKLVYEGHFKSLNNMKRKFSDATLLI